eukprot:TRINITY_DN6894_c0_g2_i1.p1 TRINITY_DN6894_c0_g2~~TRINITY_DN6894_c0_g2_i1.p1  ORF type:complete len:113 (-),score=10.31 TRINITY_DN6894_c0_g2_i1:67-405(-)
MCIRDRDLFEDKKKRHRRTASEIERHYICAVETCRKSYGSEGSLIQHTRLKHPDFYSQNYANLTQLARQKSASNGGAQDQQSPSKESVGQSVSEKNDLTSGKENKKINAKAV